MKRDFIFATFILYGACNSTPLRVAEPQKVVPLSPDQMNGPFVQAGTTVKMHFDQALGTLITKKGQRFTATIDDNVFASDGSLLLAQGTKLRGKILDVDSGVRPSLKVDFETVDSVRGPIPIDARVAHLGHILETHLRFDPYVFGYDPIRGYDVTFYSYAPLAGLYAFGPTTERDIFIPAGTELVLQLTRPLVASDARLSW